ncbi:hypothetical protein [Cesiribacter andamanensis]|uniref:Uncharacterized protein n=1 Tax=Cesiribacter andamanensis AMV16 TaxID=1279009 RepID=M7NPH9_9BACT|nr:hypothetical protein [Cesiribacter andamanensis]EMR03625.1 hypothetical protein ADICEAN_01222 [Cesiribacter andamanensis AMV16]
MSQGVVKTEKKIVESYDISNSSETLHLAQDLAKFIRENRLAMQIQGKDYVNVEGWQYAGARLGILPVIEEVKRIETGDDEMKYQAHVKLMNLKTDTIVGSGFAICSNKESGKRYYQEFAIASMAQTRAIGKAYRNILAWIIRAAGYEPTPAEEMDFLVRDDSSSTKTQSRAYDREPASPARSAGAAASMVSEPASPAGGPASPARIKAAAPKKVKEAANAAAEEAVSTAATSEAAAPKATAPLASVKQKTELLLLLNNKHITNDEKARMIENINTLDSERIQKAIEKVKKVIDERNDDAQAA